MKTTKKIRPAIPPGFPPATRVPLVYQKIKKVNRFNNLKKFNVMKTLVKPLVIALMVLYPAFVIAVMIISIF
jgi:hypothetical protein